MRLLLLPQNNTWVRIKYRIVQRHITVEVAIINFSVLVADIFGTNSLELIPAYLLIAETSIGLNKLREAEQQLQKGKSTP